LSRIPPFREAPTRKAKLDCYRVNFVVSSEAADDDPARRPASPCVSPARAC
jgi:hypothetical protein